MSDPDERDRYKGTGKGKRQKQKRRRWIPDQVGNDNGGGGIVSKNGDSCKKKASRKGRL